MGVGPQTLVEHAGDAGMQAIHEFLDGRGLKIESLVVLLRIDKAPEGELDSVTCGMNVGDARDLVVELTGHLVQAAAAIGMQVNVIPVREPGQG